MLSYPKSFFYTILVVYLYVSFFTKFSLSSSFSCWFSFSKFFTFCWSSIIMRSLKILLRPVWISIDLDSLSFFLDHKIYQLHIPNKAAMFGIDWHTDPVSFMLSCSCRVNILSWGYVPIEFKSHHKQPNLLTLSLDGT